MFRISKDVTFAASHVLGGLPEGHKCGRLHGHNYRVTVELQAEVLDEAGMVLDYGAMDDLFVRVRERLDHRHLNDVMIGNPTAECLAKLVHAWAGEEVGSRVVVTAVRVHETERTMAEYRP